MINLLPPETRQNIMHARHSKILLKWIVAISIGLAGILIVILFGLFYIDQTTKQISQQVNQGQQELKTLKIEETQKRVEEMSNSFKLATQVLSQQVLFSEVLQQVGAVMPNGASLANLSVEQLSGGLNLQVKVIDHQTATQVQVNLEDPANKLFERVDLVSTTCSDENSQTDNQYGCTANYRALFKADNNPFLLLTTGDKES